MRRFQQRIISVFCSKIIILLYHRIFKTSLDPQSLCVTPQHFNEHLEHLKRHYQIISLKELIRALGEKSLPRRAVAITFDDGYADNNFAAKPLLERYEVPATIFVSMGYLGQKQEFWWDDLERILLLPKKLPSSLNLNINNNLYSWKIDNPSSRRKIYNELHVIFYSLESAARSQALAGLANWAGLSPDGRPDYLALSLEDLELLSNNGLIEIGSHGSAHVVLSRQLVEIQRKEIVESKLNLEEILKRSIESFAYAYGGSNDVGNVAINLVRQAGYKIGCANFGACVTDKSNFFFLPRYLVCDWNKKEFAITLKRFFSN